MKTLRMPSGRQVPVLGQGTWHMGEQPARRSQEVAALRLGLDLGMSLIDTAEMYGDGGAEEVVGEAIAGRRSEVYLVSKVYPHNGGRRGARAACERSLRRLGTECIDLYLLHWPGSVPFDETLAAFESLQRDGLIGAYGVSNFDLDELRDGWRMRGGAGIATNQVLYNLGRRGVEFDLLPWCRAQGMPVMAYSPLESAGPEQRALLDRPALQAVAARHCASPAQVALAWLLRQDGMIAIPKAVAPDHVRANRAALDLSLSSADLAELDEAFPPPSRRRPLDIR